LPYLKKSGDLILLKQALRKLKSANNSTRLKSGKRAKISATCGGPTLKLIFQNVLKH